MLRSVNELKEYIAMAAYQQSIFKSCQFLIDNNELQQVTCRVGPEERRAIKLTSVGIVGEDKIKLEK